MDHHQHEERLDTLYTHLDTGAVDTQLNLRFARESPDLIEADKGSTKITGYSGTIEVDTLKAPALARKVEFEPITKIYSGMDDKLTFCPVGGRRQTLAAEGRFWKAV